MMERGLDQIVNDYTEIYSQLKKKLKWSVSDARSLMLVSSLYIMKGKPFEMERFQNVSEYIKKNVGLFSTLKSSQRFTTAAMLDIRCSNPNDKFHEYLDLYGQLVKGGFRRGPFTYIASLSLLNNDTSTENPEYLIERAMAVYKAMKKEHFFLTGDSDYPLAILLAQLEEPIEELMERIAYFYQELNKNSLRKGNDLQFLSHILSLQKEVEPDFLIERTTSLLDEFKQAGRRIKTVYYPVIGLLALLETSSNNEVKDIMDLYHRLNSEKLFKRHKDMNFILSVNFIVKDKLDDASLISTGIQTTIESIIQAQQAAMIAAMAGGAAAASANSGSS
ncbi:DUF4003 domain-containing protein [Anaerobacillus sp. CMMVII]|uniref:DUF4003 domain-containing protein n=1 Tax=Anaerobacillus sp. CMMVII TaxID=2755588 RepID=UPI0021B79D05|nr:DUF4003 domain-containing protein [Anaerobacillus sp. CMMVII]MCT8137810.1 DUF4003 domain-containing protein [Anaerobacillus sp. CMMVII]